MYCLNNEIHALLIVILGNQISFLKFIGTYINIDAIV